VPNVTYKSEALLGSEPCCVLQAAQNSAVFKWYLKDANKGADQRLEENSTLME